MKFSSHNSRKGFTLVELLVVLSLISVLAVLAMPTYNNMRHNVALETERQEVVSALRIAQQRAIASYGFEPHGVHFNTDSFVIFGDSWTSPSYVITYDLPADIQFVQGQNSSVTFDRLTGTTGNTTVSVGYPGGDMRTISISESGTISSL